MFIIEPPINEATTNKTGKIWVKINLVDNNTDDIDIVDNDVDIIAAKKKFKVKLVNTTSTNKTASKKQYTFVFIAECVY